ncbi:MAG: gliding motility lipoprotein GldD [Bacteroidota bacterium]
MKSRFIFFVFVASLLALGCQDDVLPKPKAMLRLDYGQAQYVALEDTCAYTFAHNELAQVATKGDCSIELNYTMMKGSIYLTYKKINGNLNTLLADAQKLSYEHVVKADNILEQPFANPKDNVYGMFYQVTGDAASQSQFYVTDSTEHFVTGSLYFYAKPNYDSIYPAAIYLQKDVRKIMESLRWND